MHTVPRLYQDFRPDHYQLELSLDRPGRQFSGVVQITGTWINDTHVALHAKDLEISSVMIADHPVQYDLVGDTLSVFPDSSLHKGALTITIAYTGAITDGMHGLYPCYYTLDGEDKELLATQFESHHAREVLPCVDEPEAKATFDVTLLTETGVTVLGNMPVMGQSEEHGRLRTTFDSTPRMSPYLLAFVVGDLQRATGQTTNGTEVNVYATHAQPAESLTFALETAVKSIEYFNEQFNTPYPLPKCDHVALPDFSSGAMENWGLITYREMALLATESTAVSMKEYIATVIAHETSHQWFGNLVTMQWWDDLWLNESFATLMEYLAIDAIHPQWNIWSTFATSESFAALRRDRLPGVQAVKTDVNHPDEISTLFDSAIVYAKGARLLYMLHRWIGAEAFRVGLSNYFERHAYSNTTGDDLWQALSEASGKDVKSFMHRWITQPGLPVVTVARSENRLTLAQRRFVVGEDPDDSLWPIPLGASVPGLPELLDEASTVITPVPGGTLYLNTENSAHFVTAYDASLYGDLRQAITAGSLGIVDRLALLHETSLLSAAGLIPATQVFELLLSYTGERDEPVWDTISLIIADLKRFVEQDETAEAALKAHITTLTLPLYEELGWQRKTGETEAQTKLRATILGLLSYSDYQPVIDTGRSLFADHRTDLQEIDGEIRGIVLSIAAKHGTDDDRQHMIDLYPRTASPELQRDISDGLTSTKDPATIDVLLTMLTDKSIIRPQDVVRWFAMLIRSRYSREATWQWMTDKWDWIEQTFASDKSYDYFPQYSASGFSTNEWLERYTTFFGPLKERPALTRAIELGTREIANRAAWLERDGDELRATVTTRASD